MKTLRLIFVLFIFWLIIFITILSLPFIMMCGFCGETENLNAIAERVGEKIKEQFICFVEGKAQ